MKIFLTGATGYIGGTVAECLIANGFDVTGLTSNWKKLQLLYSEECGR